MIPARMFVQGLRVRHAAQMLRAQAGVPRRNVVLFLLFKLMRQDSPLNDAFWNAVFSMTDWFHVPFDLVIEAMSRLPF